MSMNLKLHGHACERRPAAWMNRTDGAVSRAWLMSGAAEELDNKCFPVVDAPEEIRLCRRLFSQQAARHHLDIVVRSDRQTAKGPAVLIGYVNLAALNLVASEKHNATVALVAWCDSGHDGFRLRHVGHRPCRPHRQGLGLLIARPDERVGLDFCRRYRLAPWDAGVDHKRAENRLATFTRRLQLGQLTGHAVVKV